MKKSSIKVKGGRKMNFSGKQVIMAGIIRIRPDGAFPTLKPGKSA